MRAFVDARMAGHSGIGVVLDAVLRAWLADPPAFDLVLLGGGAHVESLLHNAPGHVAERVRLVPWNDFIYSPLAALYSVGKLGARRGDVFFSPHYATAVRPGVPLVCFIQDVIHWTHPPRRGTSAYSRAYFRQLAASAAYVLAPSRHVKVQLQTLLGFKAHRVLRVPLGPGGAGAVEPESAPAPQVAGGAYMLALGLYKAHKNWDFMLARLAGMWRSGALAHRLVAGGLGPERARDRFRARLDELGITERVEILEHQPASRLAAIYRDAAALLFPSLAEGFGLPILEAQRLGTPVLIAEREPMTEVAGAGALTFDPDRPDMFDGGVLALAAGGDLRSRLVAAGAENVSRYSWDATARHIAEVLIRASRGEHVREPSVP